MSKEESKNVEKQSGQNVVNQEEQDNSKDTPKDGFRYDYDDASDV